MTRYPVALIATFQLVPAAVAVAQTPEPELPAVTITAPTASQELKQELRAEQALTPGGVTLVDSDELYQRNISSLADSLRYVPGVWAASLSGADAMFFSIRGSNLDATNYDMNGIKLLQDGLPVTTADGNNHNRVVDPLAARYAVVARGANALTYGASTLGGAIDFITPTARDTAPRDAFVSGGSHGQLQGRFSAGGVSGPVDGLVTVETKRWDGYRDHSQQEREGLYANAGLQLSDAVRTRFYATYVNNKEELPGVLTRAQWRDDPDQAEAAAVSGNYQVNVETWRVANKTTWEINPDSRLTAGISYEEQRLFHPIVDKVMVDFDGPGPLSPVEVFSLLINTKQRNLGTSLRYDLRVADHDLLAGLNYGQTKVNGGNYRNDGGHRNGLTQRVDNDADGLELFLMDRWKIAPRWTVVYGAQAVDASRDVRTTTVSSNTVRNPKADYNSINPRVGLIHQPVPDVELFANLSRLYEAPTNFELEDDVRGNNQTLDAMHGTVFEIGTRGTRTVGKVRWRWDLAAYYARLRDEILSVDDPAAPGTSLSTNVDKTVHAGIEALVAASLPLDASGSHRIEPLVSLMVNRFKFVDDRVYGDNDLPAAPSYALKGELLYRSASGFFAGPTLDMVGRRYVDFNNSYKLDAYTLWGLRAGLTRKSWEVFGELRNLTDKDHIAYTRVVDVAAPDAAVLYPGEPRSLYVGARFQF
ncbi:TonB-dependent receptor [Zoogloea sp.]|uniref:TonB-dependent receptor family protein n=1 Tax=Zoogloea sp. TaxID=49181 RepID=UPI0026266F57|nr:TonB-dependent receptor [Zoogloea sp.]MDD3354021.1 TonB-dependent receptor [Zoogloea sp.]